MEDRLVIGYDKSESKDHSCLHILRRQGRGAYVVNSFYDKEAEEIYYKLVSKGDKSNGKTK